MSTAIVLIESLTGTTWKAGERIAANLQQHGWGISAVCSVRRPELAALAAADLVVLGSWTDGIFVTAQRPAGGGHLWAMPAIAGKQAAAFCTYALNPGKVPEKMSAILEAKGADVLGGLALHRRKIDAHAEEFVARLLDNVAA